MFWTLIGFLGKLFLHRHRSLNARSRSRNDVGVPFCQGERSSGQYCYNKKKTSTVKAIDAGNDVQCAYPVSCVGEIVFFLFCFLGKKNQLERWCVRQP
uniref:Putative secreted protein n=1 Tax=Anopheles darlingi TaxID=43151 RepID=A0A2M4DB53_ANODA